MILKRPWVGLVGAIPRGRPAWADVRERPARHRADVAMDAPASAGNLSEVPIRASCPRVATEPDDLRAAARAAGRPESAFGANPAPAGPAESITFCDGCYGTGVWPVFRERPRPARDLSAADGRAPGRSRERGGSPAGPCDRGGWFTAARARRPGEGPVPDVRPEGSGPRPGRSGSPEAIRAAAAAWPGVTYRGTVVSRGRAAPPRHRVRSLHEVHRHPGAPDAPVRADPGGKRRVRRAAGDRDLTQRRIPGFPAGTAAGPGTA